MSPIVNIIFILLAASPGDGQKHLYARIKDGDHNAFKTFYENHYNAVYHFLVSRNIRPEDAEDLIQKAFVYIWENREKIKPGLSLKSYLFRIAYTRMINHVKKNSKFEDEILENLEESNSSPVEDLEFSDLETSLKQAVEKMPEKRRKVFTSCFINERTYKETAGQMNVSVKTIESHMALALKDVRTALENFRMKKK